LKITLGDYEGNGFRRIDLIDMNFSHNDNVIFKNVNISISDQDKIALIGLNGTGKSTLIKILAEEFRLDNPASLSKSNLKVCVYDQHVAEKLDTSKTPIEYLTSYMPENKNVGEIRGILGRFGLTGSTHTQKIANLSGGEKCRLALCEIHLKKPEILLLDEPKNHLDIDAIDSLIDALNSFKGGLVLTSHNSKLIRETCNRIWICENNNISEYHGSFDQYKQQIVNQIIF
jgi:ATPase subunit of ABC transporter with duplicated ATPase domains